MVTNAGGGASSNIFLHVHLQAYFYRVGSIHGSWYICGTVWKYLENLNHICFDSMLNAFIAYNSCCVYLSSPFLAVLCLSVFVYEWQLMVWNCKNVLHVSGIYCMNITQIFNYSCSVERFLEQPEIHT